MVQFTRPLLAPVMRTILMIMVTTFGVDAVDSSKLLLFFVGCGSFLRDREKFSTLVTQK